MPKTPPIPPLAPGERRRVTPQQARQLIKAGSTISVKTCFEKSVRVTKQVAYELLDAVTDETVALRRGDEPHYHFLFLTA